MKKLITKKNLIYGIFLIALIGIVISSYLTYVHFNPTSIICTADDIASCSIVSSSSYSVIFGVPAVIWGILWFLALGLFGIRALREKSFVKEFISWNIMGLVFVAYFIFAEIKLDTICFYCTIVHILIILSFLISLWFRRNFFNTK
jgi:uncharacterized membrane protein